MTIPTREEAMKALDKLSSEYDLAGGWSPDPMPLLAALRSYIESHTGEPVAWLRDAHNGEGDECLVPCAKGDPGGFPAYASPVQPDAALTEALTRIDELEGALKPFAADYEMWRKAVDDRNIDDDHDIAIHTQLSVGDLRKASATLTQGIKE